MDGLAAARQGQDEERPKLTLAKFHKVSPLCTVMVWLTLAPAFFVDTRTLAGTGRLSSAPARIWFGSAIQRFAARSSGQRFPRPRFSCANFQRESPRCTLTVLCSAMAVAGNGRCGCIGRIVATGATGCAGLAKTVGCNGLAEIAGCVGWTKVLGGADKEKTFGCVGATRRERERTVGRTLSWKSERALGRTFGRSSSRPVTATSGRTSTGARGRTGTAEKGSRRKTFEGNLGCKAG